MAFQITRKVRFFAIALVVLLIVYAALGFWLVPRIARSQLLAFCEQHWRRTPAVGEISFNPFSLALQVRGFAFQDSRSQPLVAFDRLVVNLDVASLWRRGISLHAIELEHPFGRVMVRADGSLNLSELSAPFAATAGAAPNDDEPLRVFIDRFTLSNGAFEFEDHARATPFKARLMPVNFELLDFSTTGQSGNSYALQALSSAGEKFSWSGAFGLSPLRSSGQFELSQVQARTLWSYLQGALGFEVSDGLVAVNGGYEFAATEPALTVNVSLARVNVADLKVRARGGDTDWVALSQIALLDSKIDLTRRTIDVARVQLGEGTVSAARNADGSLNLLSLMQAPGGDPGAGPAATPEPAPTAPWTVHIPDVSVQGLHINARDEFVKPAAEFTLEPVNLHLRGFSTTPGEALDLEGDVTLQNGGKLTVQGKAVPNTPSFSGTIRLQDLNLATLQPYIGTYSQMTLLSGVLSSELEADYQPGSWRIAGDLDCVKLHTIDNALREDFIKWDGLALSGIEYRSNPQALRIARINARGPYLRMIIAPDQTTNLGKVLTRPAGAPGPVQTVRGVTAPTGAQSPMAVSIGKVQLDNGSANFADFWITPNYAVSLQQLGGTLSGLSSRKDSRAKLDLKGKIDRYAPIEIGGELNLLSASLFTDLRVKFDGVELTSVTPYSGRFAGYRIEKGKLSVNVRYRVENRKLEAEQRFVVDQLTLGERVDSPDAVKLPLRLAVALLKDRNGVIDLGLPVTGSLDDPKFRLGPIVWKAFVNLLASVATSPFKLLGGLFGGGEEVNLIDFDPGSATLDAAGKDKLAALAKALRERPQLSLEVPAVYSPDADYAQLASAQLEARLVALSRSPGVARKQTPELSEAERRFDLLRALYQRDQPGAALPLAVQALDKIHDPQADMPALALANQELESALRPRIEVIEPALQALAQQRARAIQDALLSSGEVEPARVFMLAPGAAPLANNKIRLALSLK